MSNEERILQTIQREGPILPAKIARVLGTNVLLASAQLGELSSRKKLIISHIKIGGGSPVYYLPGQEEKLQRYYDELGGKDKQAFDLLKEKKILRDKNLEPLVRVSMRGIKDFAKPLEVNINGQKEIFWKWYLVRNEEVNGLIRNLLKPPKVEVKEETKVEEPKPEIKKEFEKEVEGPKPEVKKVEVKEEVKTEIKKPEIKPIEKPKEEKQVILEAREGKPSVPRKEEPKEIEKEIKSDFFEKVKNYLHLKNIKVVEADMVRKTEINLVLSVPTAIGEILYYAKAKGKKKCNDKDVSSAFLEGQVKKLPVLFLYSGEITKKTEEMLGQDIFKNLILLHVN